MLCSQAKAEKVMNKLNLNNYIGQTFVADQYPVEIEKAKKDLPSGFVFGLNEATEAITAEGLVEVTINLVRAKPNPLSPQPLIPHGKIKALFSPNNGNPVLKSLQYEKLN
jgi:hypothetical protein